MSRRMVLAVLSLSLMATACASDEPGAAPETTTSTTTEPPVVLTASDVGVTPEVIRLGFLGINFDILRELGLVDINRGDFNQIVDAFVDDLNNRGGIHGRMVESTVVEVSPVDMIGADEACIRLTEDIEVFAVLGGLVGPTASANPCFTTQQNTIMIGGAPSTDERRAATAPWISSQAGPDTHFPAALKLMQSEGLLDGRVGVSWDITEDRMAQDLVLPALTDLGIDVVGTYVQGTQEGDAFAGQVEWETIFQLIERDEVETMLMLEVTATFGAHQLLANGFEGGMLVLDDTSITATIGTRRQSDLEDLAHIIGTGWLDSPEAWAQVVMQECVAVFEAANPDITVLQSNTVPSGEPNWSASIASVCNYMRMFEWGAHNAGPDLTQETFVTGIEEIGAFDLVGQGPASLGPGRHSAGNATRLVQFDPTDLPDGGTRPIGPLLTYDEIAAS